MTAPAAAPRVAAADHDIRRDLLIVLAAFVAGRLITLAVAALWLSLDPEGGSSTIADALCRWDCRWYIYTADKGYDAVPMHWARGDGANWAFFPLLPILMHAVSALLPVSTRTAGFLVANAAFLVAVVAFHVTARDLFGRAFARFAAVLLALWPFSIHATVPMSESVYWAAAVGTLMLARRDWWIAAGLAAAALSATRAVGVLGFLPLLVLAIQRHGFGALVTLRREAAPAALALALSGLGLGLFMTHLWLKTGDALAFSHIQTSWGREFKAPWWMIVDELSPWRFAPDAILRNAAHLATVAAGLAVGLVLIRRRLWPEAVLVYATFAIALTAGGAMSLARFTGALFPLVLAVALLADRPGWRGPVLAAAAAGLAGMTWLWVDLYNYGM